MSFRYARFLSFVKFAPDTLGHYRHERSVIHVEPIQGEKCPLKAKLHSLLQRGNYNERGKVRREEIDR